MWLKWVIHWLSTGLSMCSEKLSGLMGPLAGDNGGPKPSRQLAQGSHPHETLEHYEEFQLYYALGPETSCQGFSQALCSRDTRLCLLPTSGLALSSLWSNLVIIQGCQNNHWEGWNEGKPMDRSGKVCLLLTLTEVLKRVITGQRADTHLFTYLIIHPTNVYWVFAICRSCFTITAVDRPGPCLSHGAPHIKGETESKQTSLCTLYYQKW